MFNLCSSTWPKSQLRADWAYYLGTAHKDGFDSRYADIGFVCAGRIIGTGDSLL